MAKTLASRVDLTGLIGWWRLRDQDFGGTTLTNELEGGPDITLVSPTWVKRRGRNALYFNGAANPTSYGTIDIGLNPDFSVNGASAFSSVTRVEALGNGGNGFGTTFQFGSGRPRECIRTASHYMTLGTIDGSPAGQEPASQNIYTSGKPATVAFTYNDSDDIGRWIKNGVEIATVAGVWSNVLSSATSGNFYFGASWNGGNVNSGINGYIYELAIFKNRQLSSAEAGNIFKMRRRVL